MNKNKINYNNLNQNALYISNKTKLLQLIYQTPQ